MFRNGRGFLALSLSFALFSLVGLSSVAAQANTITEPPWPGMIDSGPPTTDTLGTLSDLLDQLSRKVTDLQSQVQTLNQQLGVLQSSLMESETALELSKKLRLQEYQAAHDAISASLKQGAWWQRIAMVASGVAGGYIITKDAPGALWGAGAGALVDIVMEVSGLFRIRL